MGVGMGYTADAPFSHEKRPGLPSMPAHTSSSPRLPESFPGQHHHQGPSNNSPRILRKAPSAHALGNPTPDQRKAPPLPILTGGLSGGGTLLSPCRGTEIKRSTSTEPIRERQYRSPSSTVLFDPSSSPNYNNNNRSPSSMSIIVPPSTSVSQRSSALSNPSSSSTHWPPTSLDHYNQEDDEDDLTREESLKKIPVESSLIATMKTKVFLKQSHSQWKSLGTAKLLLFLQSPGNLKQLVVEDETSSSNSKKNGNKKVLISTIVLSDGVERVGRTGVAVDLSDNGRRTGIVYMLQVCFFLFAFFFGGGFYK